MFLEFAEKMFIELIKNVNLYIQAPPVRHSHKDFAATSLPGMPQEGVKHRYDDFGPLERETFLTDVAGVEEVLEKSSLAELIEDLRAFRPC